MNPVGGCIRGALVGLALLAASCAGTSTPEDARRADVLGRDPLFTTAIDGILWERPAFADPGSGPGPGASNTEASRQGTVEGDPRRVMLKAAKTARRLGWIITDARCSYEGGGSFSVSGWKQFDRFVATVDLYWDRTFTRLFNISAETSPVNEGGGNLLPERIGQIDFTKSCLVTGEDADSYYGRHGITLSLTYVGGPGPVVSGHRELGNVAIYSKDGEEVALMLVVDGHDFTITLNPGTYRLVPTSGNADCPESTVHVAAESTVHAPRGRFVHVQITCSVV
jgi:hypothetical protein